MFHSCTNMACSFQTVPSQYPGGNPQQLHMPLFTEKKKSIKERDGQSWTFILLIITKSRSVQSFPLPHNLNITTLTNNQAESTYYCGFWLKKNVWNYFWEALKVFSGNMLCGTTTLLHHKVQAVQWNVVGEDSYGGRQVDSRCFIVIQNVSFSFRILLY